MTYRHRCTARRATLTSGDLSVGTGSDMGIQDVGGDWKQSTRGFGRNTEVRWTPFLVEGPKICRWTAGEEVDRSDKG